MTGAIQRGIADRLTAISEDLSMSERKYGVREIDLLRDATESRWLYGTTKLYEGMRVRRLYYTAEEKAIAVEQQTRTYMLAGITAQDLYDADSPPEPPK